MKKFLLTSFAVVFLFVALVSNVQASISSSESGNNPPPLLNGERISPPEFSSSDK